MKANEYSRGSVLSYGGNQWIVLEVSADVRLLSRYVVVEHKKFSESDSQDYRESQLKVYLEDEYIKTLSGSYLDMALDLTSRLGETDYGIVTTKIAPLTRSLYEANRSVIPSANVPYWLCSPYSCYPSYMGTTLEHSVFAVMPEGYIDTVLADEKEYGIRPMVMIDGETEI